MKKRAVLVKQGRRTGWVRLEFTHLDFGGPR